MVDINSMAVLLPIVAIIAIILYNAFLSTKNDTEFDNKETYRRKSIDLGTNLFAIEFIVTALSMHPFFDQFDETGILQSKIYLAFTGLMILTWFILNKKLKKKFRSKNN